MTSARRPEDFLELVQRAKRGRLKIYIGFAAGVGKTYRMLEEAHALKARGVDVVLAIIETHGRADTAALLEGLEYVPRRAVEYRGLRIDELDLDGVLARRPEVTDRRVRTPTPRLEESQALSGRARRPRAGINVICAFNVQHLENLKEVVQRVSGIVVHETVPDTFAGGSGGTEDRSSDCAGRSTMPAGRLGAGELLPRAQSGDRAALPGGGRPDRTSPAQNGDQCRARPRSAR
jgi:two-component system sensor histidine kinase KdpD